MGHRPGRAAPRRPRPGGTRAASSAPRRSTCAICVVAVWVFNREAPRIAEAAVSARRSRAGTAAGRAARPRGRRRRASAPGISQSQSIAAVQRPDDERGGRPRRQPGSARCAAATATADRPEQAASRAPGRRCPSSANVSSSSEWASRTTSSVSRSLQPGDAEAARPDARERVVEPRVRARSRQYCVALGAERREALAGRAGRPAAPAGARRRRRSARRARPRPRAPGEAGRRGGQAQRPVLAARRAARDARRAP